MEGKRRDEEDVQDSLANRCPTKQSASSEYRLYVLSLSFRTLLKKVTMS